MHVKRATFSTDNSQTHQDFPFLPYFLRYKFHPKYPDNILTDSVLTSRTSRRLLVKKAPVKDFCKNSSQCREILLHIKWAIASFRCYDNPDVMATLIMTNFHLYLIIFSKCLSMAT